jgi:hypothetical protein
MRFSWRQSAFMRNAHFLIVDGREALQFSVIDRSEMFDYMQCAAGFDEHYQMHEGTLDDAKAWVIAQYVMKKGDL